ncbi:hypothetical protein FK220_005280 [Flavobacteriaceae bacterium TP-CH-4]|uniref:Viral A-type inclusion protein n=1 Tax=Pelagihabitans pacificus TaxID=2696054 RepID=A0A967E9S3_9FLAO|nr:hypothetical protein [Pelagihabitans pacificus]NHF58741.1 hypothetical protein [Pelagihabitans pacificus]
MAKLKNYLVSVLIFFFIFSCKEEKKATQSEGPSQMEQVMAVHDEVMPKMGKIGRLVGELKSKIDSTEQGMAYEKAMKDLQDANKSMMDWMQGFGNRFDSDEILNGKALSEEKQRWLDEEEAKMNQVKEKINSSIAKAEALLKQ